MEITDERIDAAIEFHKKIFGDNDPWPFDGYHPEDFGGSVRDAHDFALEIRRLRKREEDARGLLEKAKYKPAIDEGGDPYTACSCCGRADWDGCSDDCAIAAWLKGE